MRGYRRLKDHQRFRAIRSIKNEFVNWPITEIIKSNRRGKLIAEFTSHYPEEIVRQYVIQYFGGQRFIRSLLVSNARKKPVIVSLPRSWREMLADSQIPINDAGSQLLWYLQVLKHLGYGCYTLGQIIIASISTTKKPTPDDIINHHFIGLQANNLPCGKADSFDVITWYDSWKKKTDKTMVINHSIKSFPTQVLQNGSIIEYRPEPYKRVYGIKNKLFLISWSTAVLVSVTIQFMLGKWWNALLFGEIVKAKATELSSSVAAEYLFHHSTSIYRPLWTYVAENKGSRILCYFYSSVDQPETKEGRESQRFDWSPSTWPTFLVWDLFQKQQLKHDVPKNTKFLITGPIPFCDSNLELPKSDKPYIAVFNIDPHRPSSHFGISTSADYYAEHPNVQQLFLKDISEIAEELNINIFIKPKRDIGSIMPKSYAAILCELSAKAHVEIVRSEISPFRLISNSAATLSAPFTSPTIFGSHLSIPSAYYDPTDWTNPLDAAARGKQIISGKKQLKNWLLQILK